MQLYTKRHRFYCSCGIDLHARTMHACIVDRDGNELASKNIPTNADINKLMNRLRRKHGKGKALGVLSHKLGRTIYYMLKRGKPFDLERFIAA